MNMQMAITCVSAFLLAFSCAARAQGQESIVLDPQTGDYTITYISSDDGTTLLTAVFVPATKIAPTVTLRFKLSDHKNNISYAYTLANGSSSRQAIVGFRMLVSSADSTTLAVPPSPWDGLAAPNPGEKGGFLVDWSFLGQGGPTEGIVPGDKLKGFAFESHDLPGIVNAQLTGATPVLSFEDEGPTGDIGKQLGQQLINDFVSRVVAAPMVPIPSPFDAANVLTQIQANAQTWVGLQIVDASFEAQINSLLQAAIDALNNSNAGAAVKSLKDLRKLLKQQFPDVDKENQDDEGIDTSKTKHPAIKIDKLPARVLDFDLKFVLKQLGN